ncbi:MAG: DUF1015 domain-containing protein [Daejeonella sp.]
MPKIKPFYGIRPNPDYAGDVVLHMENLSLEEAKIIRQKNPYSYVNMLVPKLDNLFLRGSKNELAFKKINENFEEFLDKGVLIRDNKACIYIYRTSRFGRIQTGIWTVTSIDDYLNNNIRRHELTRPDREKVLVNYLQQTGIDANPVLITYSGNPEIDVIIEKACMLTPDLSFEKLGSKHELWKLDREEDIKALIDEFVDLPSAYIADGHHRAAAAARLAMGQRRLNPKFTGEEEYNFFTSVYMAFDQLDIFGFNRIIEDLNGLTPDKFLEHLGHLFTITKKSSNQVVVPLELHEFGMYLDGLWYKLVARMHTIESDKAVDELDVSILQKHVLAQLLDIPDPATNSRISFSGGLLPVDTLMKELESGAHAVVFILFPTTIKQLICVADAGEVMPPKSTWFEPKFQAGLLIHQIS